MSSTQDQIEAALRSILASVGQQDPVYLQRLAEDVQQGRPNENQSRSSRFSRQPSSGSESGERYNGAMSKGPVQRPNDDSTGLQGFSTVSQSLRNSMTSSDTTSAFAAAGNRMLSSSMSRTHNFSLPQISPLLKRRNTSTRSFVSKEPKRSEEFPIEIVFKSDSGCDSNDDHIRTHIRLCKEFSSDEVTGLIRAKLSKYIGDRHFSLRIQHWGGRQTSRELRFIDDLQPVPDGYVLALKKSKTIYVVIDEDEDSVGFQNNAFPRVPVSSITCANEDVEESVSVRTYGTPRALPSTAKNINTKHQYHSNVRVNSERCNTQSQEFATTSPIPNHIRGTYAESSSPHEGILMQRNVQSSSSSCAQSLDDIEENSNASNSVDFSAFQSAESIYRNFVQSLRAVGRQDIRVSRESLGDSMVILASPTFDPYTAPKVEFIGEAGIDMGALRKTWLYETAQKVFTENYCGTPVFDGKIRHKLPSAECRFPSTVFRAVSNLAICSLVHGSYALAGLSNCFLQFLMARDFSESTDFFWEVDDLSYEAQVAISAIEKIQIQADTTTGEMLGLQQFATQLSFTIPNTSDEAIRATRKIAYEDIFRRRLGVMKIMKTKFEACGINEFLRSNPRCARIVFPEEIVVNVDSIINVLQTPCIASNTPAYTLEKTAKDLIIEFLRKHKNEQDVLKKFLTTCTGSPDPPCRNDKITIEAATSLHFRACSCTIEVPPAFSEDMLAMAIEIGGRVNAEFDSV